MKTRHFQNLDNSLDTEVITDGIKDQKEFTITEWPLRGYNGDVEAMGMDWNVDPVNEEKFVEFAKEHNLTLTAIGENSSESLVTAESPARPTTTPVSPTDGQQNVYLGGDALNFMWEKVEGAEAYTLTYNTISGGVETNASKIVTIPSTMVTDLLCGIEYKWWVTAHVPGMQDSISGPWTFTTADYTASSN